MTIDTTVTSTELTPTPAVVLARRYERDTLDQTIDEAIRRVRKAVTAARVPTAGPPFVRFLSIGDRGEIEVGLPLDGPHVVPTLRATILPGGTAASAWHRGDESGILDLLRLVERWVADNGTPAGPPWVWYWTPGDSDPFRAQVVWPMRRP